MTGFNVGCLDEVDVLLKFKDIVTLMMEKIIRLIINKNVPPKYLNYKKLKINI